MSSTLKPQQEPVDQTGQKETPVLGRDEEDDDDISLTSTAESDPQEEYEVETIHAQEWIEGRKMYLVKWKGYPDLRCTWEPKESFNTKEILRSWKEKRSQIDRGLRKPFDIEAWLAEVEASETACEERKRRRNEKRARLGLSVSKRQDQQELDPVTAASSKESVSVVAPVDTITPTRDTFSSTERRASGQSTPPIQSTSRQESTSRRGSATQSIDKQTERPRLKPLLPAPAKPPLNPAPRRIEIPKAPPPKPVNIKVIDGRVERRDLANIVNRARQQPKPPAEQKKTWKLMRTTYRFGKASQQDPEPNREFLELQSPKTWSPFQMTSSLRRRSENTDNDSLFVEQEEEEVAETQPAVLNQSLVEAMDGSSMVQTPRYDTTQESRREDTSAPIETSRGSPSTESPDHFPLQNKLPPGPRKWRAGNTGIVVGGRQLRKKEDLLCQISWGPEGNEIGDASVCDLSSRAQSQVFHLKYQNSIKIRFDDLCSLERLRLLLNEEYPTSTEWDFNGFVLPFSDTQRALSEFETFMVDKDVVAIARIVPRPSEPDRGSTLICYPTASKSFQFLNRPGYCSPSDTLRLAGLYRILPRNALNTDQDRGNSSTKRLMQRPERQGRSEEILAPWHPPIPIVSTSAHIKDPVVGRSEPPKEVPSSIPNVRKDKVATESTKPPVAAAPISNEQDESVDLMADDDAMDISSEFSVEHPEIPKDPLRPQVLSSENSTGIAAVDNSSNREISFDTIQETKDTTMLDVNDPENIKLLLQNALKITYEELAAVTTHSGVKPANCFYLWFPEDADVDFQVLENFLDLHFAIVLSNRKQNDWEKFTKSSSGVALFHHSFLHYSDMPGLYKLMMSSSFNFWNVSLSGNIPGTEPETHFQRLFPQGTGYLMTEDFMLHERDAAITVLAWFRDTAMSKFPGTTKMMFRPGVLKWLDKMSDEDPRFAVMAVLICDTASDNDPSRWPIEARDLDFFYNPYLESPVISLEDWAPIENANQTSRPLNESDMICEVFAAWAVLNAASLRKFQIITHDKPMDRWKKWQHIEIIRGANEFFRKSNINTDSYKKWLAQDPANLGSAASSSASASVSAQRSGQSAPSPSLGGRNAGTTATATLPAGKSKD